MSGIDGVGGRLPVSGGFGTAASGGFAAAATLASPKLKDDATLQAIARGEQTFANGSRGAAVKKLQEALNQAGARLTPDGAFGAKSAAAVKELQTRAGLPATGRVDAATLAALDRELVGVAHPG